MAGNNEHAVLSPSGAERWLNCTPSVLAGGKCGIVEQESVYAKEGSLAHELAALNLLFENGFIGFWDSEPYEKNLADIRANDLYTGEMEEEVEKYVKIVTEEYRAIKQKTPDAILIVESRLDLSEYIPFSFGTCDAAIIADDVIYNFDLKFGKGVKVSATDNPQLKIYSLGVYSEYEAFFDIKKVKMAIIQPRIDNYSSFEMGIKDLKSWGEKELKPGAKKAFEGKGVQKIGEHCRWCEAAPRCATLASKALKLVERQFKDPHLLTDDQLVESFKMFDIILKWVSSTSSYMLTEAINGKKFNGLKVVEGRSNRKWKDEEGLKEALLKEGFKNDDILNTKIKGIGDIEKLVKSHPFFKELQKFYNKPPGAPVLVLDSDVRAEYSAQDRAKKDFS